MQQAHDFKQESDELGALLTGLSTDDWTRATQFKQWTINDVLVHLYFWNRAADRALTDPSGFKGFITGVMAEMADTGLRPIENRQVAARGPELLGLWQDHYRDMAARWAALDPKTRVAWVGPDMSVRSAITARQMETWAHGMEVFDLLGTRRAETDRIRNVVMLGVNTFAWSHKAQGLPVPETMPHLRLYAPSGAIWEFGAPDGNERIEGSAVGFAQVVTQTRNIADTDLAVTGPVATRWMATAQCFAGPKETPPAPGARHLVAD